MNVNVNVNGKRDGRGETYMAARLIGFADFFARKVRVLGHGWRPIRSLRSGSCGKLNGVWTVLHSRTDVPTHAGRGQGSLWGLAAIDSN